MYLNKLNIITCLSVCLLLICCQGKPKWEDYQGGNHIVLQVETTDGSAKDLANAQKIAETIKRRLSDLGIKKRIINVQDNRIIIQFPQKKNSEFLVNLISTQCVLEFKLVSEAIKFKNGHYENMPNDREALYMAQLEHNSQKKIPLVVFKKPLLTGEYIQDIKVTIDKLLEKPYIACISGSFNDQGTQLFRQITEKYKGRKLAIVINEEIYSAPRITSIIPNGHFIITGNFTVEEAKAIVSAIKTGDSPVHTKLLEHKMIDKSDWLGTSL